MDNFQLPSAWQDWHITEELGEGAYGRVYRAEKENGGVKAISAIKVIQVPSERSELLSLRREFQTEEELRRNLKEIVDGYTGEIRAMYRLQGHSHIVSIQDHLVEELKNEIGWRIYIRMEYLQSFNDYALTHTFTQDEIIRLGISLCEALGVCAEYGILHRDIKPENLFVTENGQFKLGDFGIAKALNRTVSTYSSKGTFSYMAPEVFHGTPYDTRADLYSTGIVLYKLANRNRDPFIDPEKQIITHQDREEAMSLRLKGEKLPAPVDADDRFAQVILKACEYEPKDRYSSPDDMAFALKEILQSEKQSGTKPKTNWLWGLCAFVFLAIIIAVVVGRGNLTIHTGEKAITVTSDVSDEVAKRIQEFCGVRYTLPDGYKIDTERSTEDGYLWVNDNLKIGFLAGTEEYQPTGENEITIGGYSATYDPTKTIEEWEEPYVYATYANPLPGDYHAVYIMLIGPKEEIMDPKVNNVFLEMLINAERI